MPTFQYPWVLLLLPLAALAARRPGWPTAAFALPLTNLGHDRLSRRTVRGYVAEVALRTVVGLCLVVGLSGPRLPDHGGATATEGIALTLVVDVSASMATEDFRWAESKLSRLAGVQKVFRLMVAGGEGPEGVRFAGRPQDLIGLVSFATRPQTDCPLTLDHDALLYQLDRLRPRTLVAEATSNPGDALAWALAGLRSAPTRRKVLVLLTDGESNVPPPALTPLQAGQLAAALDIPVYTMDALDEADAGDDARRARETLQSLAKLTGGRYFQAGDGAALTEALHELDRLERDRLQDFAAERHLALGPWLALSAFVAWLVLLLLQATRGRALP